MGELSRRFMPVIVLAVCGAIAFVLIKTAPEAARQPPTQVIPVVETAEVMPVDYQVNVDSQGTLVPRTQSTLVSEVAGRIVGLSPNFRNGGFIEQDEVLVTIDAVEYRLAAANIEASLAGVEARLAELNTTARNLEKSLAIDTQHLQLAERQFSRLSKLRKQGTVAQSALEQSEQEYLLRKASLQNLRNSLDLIPAQRRVLQAELELQQAQLATARLNLQRTEITAPYAGRVLEKGVDIGQSVSKGSVLATIYSIDIAEIRLPVTDRDAAFLKVPNGQPESQTGRVRLFATTGAQRSEWSGRLVRSEGAVDTRTRQSFLIVEVETPYDLSPEGVPPLKVGQFMEALIPGRILHDVFVLPRKAVRADDEVLVVTPDSRIQRRRLNVVWEDTASVVVGSGLEAGERISLTALPYAPDGARVNAGRQPDGVAPPAED